MRRRCNAIWPSWRVQIATLSSRRLDILAGMLSRADGRSMPASRRGGASRKSPSSDGPGQRRVLGVGRRGHLGGDGQCGLFPRGAAIRRVRPARPVLLLGGIAAVYRASEVRERTAMIDAKASVDRAADPIGERGGRDGRTGRTSCRSSGPPTGRNSPSSQITTSSRARQHGQR